MTPIFVRPVREQLEHDRLIRFLHAKFKAKRKFDVLANVGDERQAPIKVGNNTYFPDLILLDGKKVAALIEVETGESTNNLEAMAQWRRDIDALYQGHAGDRNLVVSPGERSVRPRPRASRQRRRARLVERLEGRVDAGRLATAQARFAATPSTSTASR